MGLNNVGTIRHRTKKCSEFDSAGLFPQPQQKVGLWEVKAFTVPPPVGAFIRLHSENLIDFPPPVDF